MRGVSPWIRKRERADDDDDVRRREKAFSGEGVCVGWI